MLHSPRWPLGGAFSMKKPLRPLLICIALCLLAQVVTAGVSAQTEEIAELRADRDEIRASRARAAADLDPLFAANEDIEEALRVLTEDLSGRQAALEATRSRLQKARADVIAAQDQVVQEQIRIEVLRVLLQQQAISAYVQPRSNGVNEEVLSASDLNEGERRRALVLAVNTSQNDILDQLRAAEANIELAVARAQEAQKDIEARQQLESQQYAEVQDAIAKQSRLGNILTQRIAEFQAEVDAHAADEDALTAQITGLIVREEARQAAILEAARIKAERERVAVEEARLAAQRAADLAAGRVPAQDAVVNRAAAALVSAPSAGSVGPLMWPVQGSLSSGFGPRWGRQHNGLDISANTGTPVLAAGSGLVVGAGRSGGFGNLVLIDHGGGLVTAYAHLNSVNVSSGQQVSAGNSVGTVGCTGSCTGPHLHFETRVNGVPYDPRSYLS